MSDSKSNFSDPTQQRQMALALSRWDSEGGAGPHGSQRSGEALSADPELTNAELVQLRIRVRSRFSRKPLIDNLSSCAKWQPTSHRDRASHNTL